MKNLILVIAAFCFAAIVSAQSSTTPAATNGAKAATGSTAATASTTPAKATAGGMYGCPKCDFTSQKEGKCPHCSAALVKDHAYFCADGSTSDKPGKCKDGKEMAMMDCKAKLVNAKKAAKPATPAAAPAATPTK